MRCRRGTPSTSTWAAKVGPATCSSGAAMVSVFSPFKASTEYFQPSAKPFMFNLRVDDLAGVLAALRAEGCNVLERGADDPQQGKFGYVLDPEGNLVELWEPPAE